ncbi:glycosyltransferase family 39 protein [Candidatus Sumerlaeota bacterium]|nr:glycosyltransferase family 39 protein [Candidatus Sumerlaeota bacterium]
MGKKVKISWLPGHFYIVLLLQVISLPILVKSQKMKPIHWVWLFLFAWQIYFLFKRRKDRRYRGSVILRRSLKISLSIILIIAALLRIVNIDGIPPGLWVDELYTASNALDLTARYWKNPFYMTPLVGKGWVETSNLYLYYVRLIWLLFGLSYIGMKMVSILPGIFAVFFLYFLARKLWGFRAGLAAAFFLGINAWQIGLSRWGWDETLLTALQIPVFIFLWKGLRRGGYFDFAFSGFLLGLCLYTHTASRILAIFVLFYLLLEWTLSRKAGKFFFKRLWIFFLFFVLSAFPFGIYMYRNPGVFTARYNEVSIFSQMRREGSVLPLFSNIGNHLLMFHVKSDPNIRHHIADKPVLDIISGLFMITGVLVAFLGFRRRKNRFVLLWLLFGLLGGMLSVSQGGPHTYRTGVTAPPAFILCGIGLAWVIRISRGIMDIPREKYLYLNIAIGLLLALSLGINVHRYFISYPEDPKLWREFWGSEETLFAREVAHWQDMGETVWLDSAYRSNYYFLYHAALKVISGGVPEYFDPFTREPHPGNGKAIVFLPSFRKAFYEKYFPGSSLDPVKNPLGETSLYYLTIDKAGLQVSPEIGLEERQICEVTYFRENQVIKRETRENLNLDAVPEQTKGIIIKTRFYAPKEEYLLFKLECNAPVEMSIDGMKIVMNEKNEAFTLLKAGARSLEILIRDIRDRVQIRLLWRPHLKKDEPIPHEFLSITQRI